MLSSTIEIFIAVYYYDHIKLFRQVHVVVEHIIMYTFHPLFMWHLSSIHQIYL